MDKKTVRHDLRILSRSLTPALRSSLSAYVVAAICSDPCFENATHIGLYHALPDEPDLTEILAHEWGVSKTFYLPRVLGDDMAFYRYRGANSLSRGAFGIQEPDGYEAPVDPSLLDLIYVPALAFDSRGYRLGRGKGYYDRFLPLVTKARKVGLTYGLRAISLLPTDPWDVPVDMVLSASDLAQIATQEDE